MKALEVTSEWIQEWRNLRRIKMMGVEWSVFLLKRIKISRYSCQLMVKPLGSRRKSCPTGPNSVPRSMKVRKVQQLVPSKSFALSLKRKLKLQSLRQRRQITKQSSIGSLAVSKLTTQTQRHPCRICECASTKLSSFSRSDLSKWSSGKTQ